MLFSTGNNVIDIDILNTKELYYGRLGVWQRCQCPVCSNFDENIQRFDENKFRFFKELGISPDKCYDLWAYEPGKSEGTQRYILSYPVVCKCINYTPGEEEWFCLEEGLSVSIVLDEDGDRLVLDWELKWTHK